MVAATKSDRLAKTMLELGVEAIVCSSRENFTYLTGFRSPLLDSLRYLECYALLAGQECDRTIAVVPEAVLYPILRSGNGTVTVFTYGRFYVSETHGSEGPVIADPYSQGLARHFDTSAAALCCAMRELRLETASIGVDRLGIGADTWNVLAEKFPRARFYPAEEALRKARAIKSADELSIIRRVVAITEEGVRRGMEVMREGGTEQDFVNALYSYASSQGAEPGCYLVGFGPSGALVGPPSETNRARPGIPLKVDVGCMYRGYWSDLARSFVIGQADAKLRKYYSALLSGHDAALSTIRHGVPVSVPFHAAVETVRAAGIPHYTRNHCGHGIGLELWEYPLVQPDQDGAGPVILETGMVLNIEIPYYELGFGALTVEDTVLVRENDCEVLSSLPRGLEL